MSYVKPHMTQALSKHALEHVSEGVWRMRRDFRTDYRVLITFNDEGIVIQGDIGLGPSQNGICSRAGYGVGWFGKPLSEDYLCSKFLSKRWQLEAAQADIEQWILQAQHELDESKRVEVEGVPEEDHAETLADADFSYEEKNLANWKKLRESVNEETSSKELYDEGSDLFTDFWDYEVGHDYDLADAGWLCALQQRFAVLYQEWAPPDPT